MGGLSQEEAKGGEVFPSLVKGGVRDGKAMEDGFGPLVGGEGEGSGKSKVVNSLGDGG